MKWLALIYRKQVAFDIREEFEIGIMIAIGYQDTFCHHFNACLRAKLSILI